jgi:hypothetical protein
MLTQKINFHIIRNNKNVEGEKKLTFFKTY